MSKHVSPKSQGSGQHRAPHLTANSAVSEPWQDGSLREGDGLILGMGRGSPDASVIAHRQALIAKATGGDADAQCRMGDLCRVGDEFTAQDFGEALRWYRLSAEQGDPNAENNVGAMHEHGMGVPEDMAEAARWYRLSANHGLSIGQYNLGVLLLYGNGIQQDEEEAAAWLHKAAEQGDIQALSELGVMYLFGRGVERRIAIAAEMLTVAALDGDMNALGNLADNHHLIEADAKDGSLLSALSLAKAYDRGLQVEQNKAKMFAWLLWGEERGNRDHDADVREEHDSMRGFYGMVLGDDIKDEAWALLNQMRAANPYVGGSKLKRIRKPSPRQTKSATLERLAGGG